ncbi:conserved membrane hypothetical protein [Paraburkholderia tropica]|uniref:hypothetical protein n=1 Tax=Paraburkholderia tropica TaxID=92647 RepID=UPI001CAAB64A|nr:hypothetical protein [Paraburkholderia tropica]CAG9191196.1 conserved membrane hypothetical protein [Paraburkholderia tropica]
MKKIEIAGDFIWQLLKELSFVQCILLGLIVSALFYLMWSGGAMLGGSLPLWAMAAGVAGLAVVMLGAVRMGHAKTGLLGVLVVCAFMLQLGSANVLAPDATEHVHIGPSRLLSLETLTQMIAWLLAVGSMLAGFIVGAAYVVWSRERRRERLAAKASA